ncbi:MAG: YcxB family protein, partial [Lachnospiraceae bacterium]|nr:YcxB family protein [Lachnospiraceae bacterium]
MPVDDKEKDANESELFNFSFWINEEKWERVLFDTTEILRSGVLGGSNKNIVIWAIFGINLAFFVCGCIFYFDIIFLSILLITLFVLFLMLKNVKGNPKTLINKQLKKGILQSDIYGEWKVSITETDAMWIDPRQSRTMMSWDMFSWLVETESTFYLFCTDKRHFVMILKECIGSYEQAEALKQLCTEKNITVTMGKKVKYIPNWVFNLLMIVLAAAYLISTIRLSVRDSRRSAQENLQDFGPVYYYQSEEFNSADYPAYVPIDKQAEILREQGLTVSEKSVEAAKDAINGYERMRIYLEGYPYTWLLTQMGA